MEEIIETIVKKLKDKGGSNLIGILLVGSWGRKNNDNYSDYDFVVIYGDIKNPVYKQGINIISNKMVGFRNVPVDFIKNKFFTQVEKNAYSNSIILYEKNNTIKKLISKKCVFEKNERLDLFCTYLYKISNIFNVANNYKNCWNGCGELQKSLYRKQEIYTQIEKIDVLRYVFYLELLNKNIFIPGDKVLFSDWVYNKFPRLQEVKKKFLKIKNPMKFVEEVIPILSEIISEFEKQTLLPDNIYEYALKITRNK